MNQNKSALSGRTRSILIAAACVLIWVNIFSPSAGTTIEMTTTEVGEAQSAGELLVSTLTVSDFSDLWDKSNMLPLIIFAIIFGFCVSACGGDETPMGKLLINLNDIILIDLHTHLPDGLIVNHNPASFYQLLARSSGCDTAL